MDPYVKAMFGIHAVQAPVQLLMQDMGTLTDGRSLTLAAAIIATSERLVTPGYAHELIVGDMVIRPFGRWASERKWRGWGISGLIKSEAVFPEGHDVQILDNGWSTMKKRAGQ